MRWFWIATLTVMSAAAVTVAPLSASKGPEITITADQSPLDKLFAQLKRAGSATEAEAITTQIWQHWFQIENGVVTHHLNRAHLLRRSGAFKEALAELDKVVELAPDFAEGWNQRATVLFMLKRDGESVVDIQKVLRLEPRHFGALSGLGLIHMRAENWKSAIASFERALEVHPFLGERRFIPALKEKLKGQSL